MEYFVDRYARKAGKNIKHINKKTLQSVVFLAGKHPRITDPLSNVP